MAIVVAVVDEATLEEDGLDDDDEDAVVDEAPLEDGLDDEEEDAVVDEALQEDGLDDDDDDTAAEVLDVADVDRAIRVLMAPRQ